jgi:hypothetical protein
LATEPENIAQSKKPALAMRDNLILRRCSRRVSLLYPHLERIGKRKTMRKFTTKQFNKLLDFCAELEIAPDGIPIVNTTIDDCGYTVSFYCHFCRRRHRHGRAGAKVGKISHRATHCTESSPFQERGYYIRITKPRRKAKNKKGANHRAGK